MKRLELIWNDIRRGENIDLYITVVLALVLAVLNVLGIAPQEWVTPITMAVLALLAFASLGNRHHLESQLSLFASRDATVLRSRKDIPSFHERGQSASEIVVVGVSAITAIPPHFDFFQQKMRDGCKLRFMLLNPDSPALDVFEMTSVIPNVRTDIEQTLKVAGILIGLERAFPGRCEVRLANVYLPFGLAAFDPNKDTGIMNVEVYTYKKAVGERPHLLLTNIGDDRWFQYFRDQYEQLWSDSSPWSPQPG